LKKQRSASTSPLCSAKIRLKNVIFREKLLAKRSVQSDQTRHFSEAFSSDSRLFTAPNPNCDLSLDL
jgi:hypothetical protein